ncbi:alpha/beta hydrolase [Microbacterium tenebrionis]|uniref:alpha/beta hydrolase n=1 Tax=Microbacterium tenebrionis TaxID=2830665 RepID=UPI00158A7DEE|nr:alpha/beta hydrolase fold domain-containing protein [Microbacterium ihumii]
MRHPRIDPELRAALTIVGGVFPPTITPELIPFMRRSYASGPRDELLAGLAVTVDDIEFPGYQGALLSASIVSPEGTGGSLPALLAFHSGGMMFGDRFSGMDVALTLVAELGVRLVTVEYRLAPAHPHPIPVEDCYAALVWLVEETAALQIDPDRILLAGASAGAGLAAGVALLARDRGGPQACGMLLDYPMLDDRGVTASASEFDGIGVWDRVSNETGWRALLGESVGSDDVSEYAAPARATDLSGLPSAFIDVGTEEIFRDESVEFAARLWHAGVPTELHVWPGAFHACDIFAPHTTIARAMIRARTDWVRRTLLP